VIFRKNLSNRASSRLLRDQQNIVCCSRGRSCGRKRSLVHGNDDLLHEERYEGRSKIIGGYFRHPVTLISLRRPRGKEVKKNIKVKDAV